MKRAMMKMLSYLVTESESLKIGKRQKYIYVTDTFYSIYHEVLGLMCATCLALKVVKGRDIWRSTVSQLTYSAFVFVLEKPNT